LKEAKPFDLLIHHFINYSSCQTAYSKSFTDALVEKCSG